MVIVEHHDINHNPIFGVLHYVTPIWMAIVEHHDINHNPIFGVLHYVTPIWMVIVEHVVLYSIYRWTPPNLL